MKKAITLLTLLVVLSFSPLSAGAYSAKNIAKATILLPFRTAKYIAMGIACGICFAGWATIVDFGQPD